MFRIFSIWLLFISVAVSARDNYPRNHFADVLHYEFNLWLNDSTDAIRGMARITLRVTGTGSVSFDLVNGQAGGSGMIVSDVTADGNKLTWNQSNDKLIILLPDQKSNDTVEFSVVYSGVPADGLIISKNRFGKRVFFSDHWPDRAHNYLPCIDHPYDKASVDFIINMPAHYQVVANGIMKDEKIAGTGFKTTTWSEKEPLPVKVMAFGAADFSVEQSGVVDGIPVTSWVFTDNSTAGFSDYSVAVKPLRYYIGLIGDYPFEKLANVQSKTIYGGLENAGCIFYAEKSVTGKRDAESLIAHEEAHQWFGDCVTEADWHHIWLSEGFATYLTSMYFESFMGKEWMQADMNRTRKMVLEYYDSSEKPVIDTTVTNLMDLLNVNSYQKGGWILHMLRQELGDEAFRKGLKLFYSGFRYSNALTSDFIEVMEEVSGRQLYWFFRQWLYIPGQPEISIRYEKSGKGRYDVLISQEQQNLFIFNLELKAGPEKIKVPVSGRLTKVTVKSKIAPEIIPDPDVKLLFRLKD